MTIQLRPIKIDKDKLSSGLVELLELADYDFDQFWNQLCERSRNLTNSVCDPEDYQNTIVICGNEVYSFFDPQISNEIEVFYLCGVNQLNGSDDASILSTAMVKALSSKPADKVAPPVAS